MNSSSSHPTPLWGCYYYLPFMLTCALEYAYVTHLCVQQSTKEKECNRLEGCQWREESRGYGRRCSETVCDDPTYHEHVWQLCHPIHFVFCSLEYNNAPPYHHHCTFESVEATSAAMECMLMCAILMTRHVPPGASAPLKKKPKHITMTEERDLRLPGTFSLGLAPFLVSASRLFVGFRGTSTSDLKRKIGRSCATATRCRLSGPARVPWPSPLLSASQSFFSLSGSTAWMWTCFGSVAVPERRENKSVHQTTPSIIM